MKKITPLTDKKFWEQSGNDTPTTRPYSWFQEYFDQFVPRGIGKKALEIGVCPGNNLAAIAISHHYQPCGIDVLDSVNLLPESFAKFGIDSMQAVNGDVFKWMPQHKFDFVMSFGFIEHFTEWEKAIDRHWELLEQNGMLMIGVPTLGFFQFYLRKLTYTPSKLSEVLDSHNLEAMKLRKIVRHVRKYDKSKIVFSGHIKNMDTWITTQSPFVRPSRRWIVRTWHLIARIAAKLRLSSSTYSPYALVIIKKD